MTNWHKAALATGAVAIALAMPISTFARGGGHGFGRSFGPGGRSGGGRVRPARANDLLKRLILPCPSDCRETARECVDDADQVALDCIGAACEAEIDAATTACETRGEECHDAIGALRECAATCLDTRATDVEGCRDDLGTCVEACTSDESDGTSDE